MIRILRSDVSRQDDDYITAQAQIMDLIISE
jgi:hypothetical protein